MNKTIRRRTRVRSRIQASSSRPRLTVFRSNKHISAQIIDDSQNTTLVSFSSQQIPNPPKPKQAVAKLVGQNLATLAKTKKITQVVFDRGSYRYHGRIKALAQAAREKGLKF